MIELEQKHTRIKLLLARRGLDALLIQRVSNIEEARRQNEAGMAR